MAEKLREAYLVAVTVCRTVNQTVVSIVNRSVGWSVVMMMKGAVAKAEIATPAMGKSGGVGCKNVEEN